MMQVQHTMTVHHTMTVQRMLLVQHKWLGQCKLLGLHKSLPGSKSMEVDILVPVGKVFGKATKLGILVQLGKLLEQLGRRVASDSLVVVACRRAFVACRRVGHVLGRHNLGTEGCCSGSAVLMVQQKVTAFANMEPERGMTGMLEQELQQFQHLETALADIGIG